MSAASYSPGLEGVIAGQTAISTVGDTLTYRGYEIHELADNATFEEVAYLLLYGELPTAAQLRAFNDSLASERGVPSATIETLRHIPAGADAMDTLRSGVSLLAHFDRETADNSHDANIRKAIRVLAKVPTLIAARHRLAHGHEPVAPKPALGHAANLLYMLTGEEPDEVAARVLDVSLILYAEHEFNASTFAARVTVSTLADLHGGLVSAIATLKGPLHGGANEKAMEMLLEIGEPERAEAWVKDALARKERIMGFGHRVYKHGDTRAQILKGWVEKLAERTGNTKWARIAQIVEDTVRNEKGILPNVDFPCAPAYYMLGLSVELYTPFFVVARVAGWSAHIIEQLDNNRLIRPRSEYTGPAVRPYIPIDRR
jgi:2-methylcitrate synthase/citrate synthase II